MLNLTTDQVLALAPDLAASKAGSKLADAVNWSDLGQSPAALWGKCQGSALYQVRVDLSNTTASCSCPSRKFPCKHGLGLLLLAVQHPAAVPHTSPPPWVAEWLAKRESAQARRKTKAQTPAGETTPADPAVARRRTAQAVRTAAARERKVAGGLDMLDLWLNDLVRNGLAGLETRPLRFWEDQAARMVDAQAPGVAARVRALAALPGATPDWPDRLLAELGKLALLSEGYRSLDGLDPALADDVRCLIGWTLREDEIVERGESVTDDWLVLADRIGSEDRLRVRRTWLLGAQTRRTALALQYATSATGFAESFVAGMHQPATVAYWPAAYPQRALIRERSGRPKEWYGRLPDAGTIGYLLGGKLENGFEIAPKYIGNARLVEIAIATLATDRALLLYGIPGTAKCVKHDTLVLDTRTGRRLTIAEACQQRNVSIASLNVDYRLRTQAPTEYIDNGIRPCYRVTTQLGREIEVTLNHPFLTLAGWRQLGELQPGDRIAVPRCLPFFGKEQLSDAHVKLLGHLIAEGCLTQNVPYYTNTSPSMQHDFSQAVADAFPSLSARWYPNGIMCSVSGGRQGRYFVNQCTQWLQSLGLMGMGAGSKFIPDIIFRLPRRQIALFLSRLFGGDGSVQLRQSIGQVTVDYCGKSKRLIQDVQHLLLRFGINARFRRTSTGHYRLYVHGTEPCHTFLQEIGLFGRQTQQALAQLESVFPLSNPNLDTIPSAVWNGLTQAAVGKGFASVNAVVRMDRAVEHKAAVKRHQSMSRSRLLRLATLVDDIKLQQLAQSDIYWDTIRSIEPIGEHQVYDLSMSETHNFVANDIIVHNSWLSEHLAAGIAGDSMLLIQGTAGTDESALRYGWNYARLLAEGPSRDALVVSPMLRAMETGKLARIEELTRIPAEVQDTLITILSEKTLPVPELNIQVQARNGFNVIATANNRDKGVNELSSALTRRFNTVILPVPATLEEEVDIVERRVRSLGRALELPSEKPALEEIRRVVTIFRELREGVTGDGKTKLKTPSTTLSTAEAISVVTGGLANAAYFGDGRLGAADIAAGLTGAIVKDPVQDRVVWQEYLQTVVRERNGWKDLYRSCQDVL